MGKVDLVHQPLKWAFILDLRYPDTNRLSAALPTRISTDPLTAALERYCHPKSAETVVVFSSLN